MLAGWLALAATAMPAVGRGEDAGQGDGARGLGEEPVGARGDGARAADERGHSDRRASEQAAGPGPRFDHRAHLALPALSALSGAGACSPCHPAGPEADRTRPLSEDHRGCDGASCHAAEFYGAKSATTALCRLCHSSRDYWRAEQGLRPFPGRTAEDPPDYYVEISHRKHLIGPGAPAREAGSCVACHGPASAPRPARPGHSACAACHGDAHPSAPMVRCAACHRERRGSGGEPLADAPPRAAGSGRRARIVNFDHLEHSFDRRRKEPRAVPCRFCHAAVEGADRLVAIAPLAGQRTMVEVCGTCHAAGQTTATGRPIFAVTGRCTRCHGESFATDVALAPADHR